MQDSCHAQAAACPGTHASSWQCKVGCEVFGTAQAEFVCQLQCGAAAFPGSSARGNSMPMHSLSCMPAAGTAMQQQKRLQVCLLSHNPVCSPAAPHCGAAAPASRLHSLHIFSSYGGSTDICPAGPLAESHRDTQLDGYAEVDIIDCVQAVLKQLETLCTCNA